MFQETEDSISFKVFHINYKLKWEKLQINIVKLISFCKQCIGF